MAGIATPDYMTLTDVAKLCHNQELVPMVDEISKATTLLTSMPWKQASDALRDVTGRVTALPQATWVGLDKGVKANKGDWKQVEEGLAMIESWAETNEKTYEVSPNKDGVRWENDRMHITQLGMDAETGLIYGNPANGSQEPLGFMPRFAKVTDFEGKSGGASYDYVTLSCDGSTANSQSSILAIARGPMCPTLLYPRYKADNGLVYRHWDFENTKDQFGGNIRVAKSQFQMTFGLSIAHPKTAIRIANIETGDATSIGKIRDALFEAVAGIPQMYRNSIEFYTTGKVILELRKNYASLVQPVTYDNSGLGKNSRGDICFDGIVLRQCDQMLNTEAVVS